MELPKSITVASVALRIQSRPYDDLFYECSNEFAAVGGILVISVALAELRSQRCMWASYGYDFCPTTPAVQSVDLLALPPPCKSVKSWTLRQVCTILGGHCQSNTDGHCVSCSGKSIAGIVQVTSISKNVQRLSYPIPPAGADPATYVPTEEPPPLGITCKLGQGICFLDDPPRIGWWDTKNKCWSQDGITGIKHEKCVLVL